MFAFERETERCPRYWSRRRDKYLRDHISSPSSWLAAPVYNVVRKLATTEFSIRAKDRSVQAHNALAEEYQTIFDFFYSDVAERFILDILTQDNGGFIEVLDAPEYSDEPSTEARIGFGGFRHWDSQRVTRKGNPTLPFSVKHPDGNTYKMHRSRMIGLAEMPSPKYEHYGVGLCGASRALNALQELQDVTDTMREYYGDDLPNEVWIGKFNNPNGGSRSMAQWNDNYQEQRANTRTDKTGRRLLIPLAIEESFETHRTRTLPDDFDADKTTLRAMRAIAAAFGVSISTIWTRDMSALSGTGDAELVEQEVKGKLIGWYINEIVVAMTQYVLPDSLEISGTDHDADPDALDTLATTARTRLDAGITDVRFERIQAVDAGYMQAHEFERLELKDGRLPDGRDATALWYDPSYAGLLVSTSRYPTEPELNDRDEMLDELRRLRVSLRTQTTQIDNRSKAAQLKITYALAALNATINNYATEQ
jgi:hypothetical protein